MKQTTAGRQMHEHNDWNHPLNRLAQIFLVSTALSVAGATAAAAHKQAERNRAHPAPAPAAAAPRAR